MAQVAIAWLLSKPEVSAPIVGTTSLKNLEDIIGMLSRLIEVVEMLTFGCMRRCG